MLQKYEYKKTLINIMKKLRIYRSYKGLYLQWCLYRVNRTGSWVLRSMKASKKPVQKHRPVDTHIGN
ncbi:hypothetical protein COJ31_21530 [Bacillus cereus]|nr:hypothetical protein COJ31_21530 [Bacillus cereus]